MLALHDAVGWGAASLVAEQFRPLREVMHGAPLMGCLADGVNALASGDLDLTRAHINTVLDLGSRWHAGVLTAGLALELRQRSSEVQARRTATAALLLLPMGTPQVSAIRDLALSQRRIDVVRETLRAAPIGKPPTRCSCPFARSAIISAPHTPVLKWPDGPSCWSCSRVEPPCRRAPEPPPLPEAFLAPL